VLSLQHRTASSMHQGAIHARRISPRWRIAKNGDGPGKISTGRAERHLGQARPITAEAQTKA
jgi:hypothetical protein